ncbi:MAG: type II toxin-antitoxin system RelE/ParE family toxin [Clostridia bacterium]|nr:type II toxin-antitoxin system RelE/ParE family toxin [Clostridia bacterium]
MTLSNKYNIQITDNFKDEIANVIDYIVDKLKEPVIAYRIYDKVIKQISKLDFMPYRYPKIQNYSNRQKDLRKLSVYSFRIIYEIDNNSKQVFILHIFHSTQDYFNLL